MPMSWNRIPRRNYVNIVTATDRPIKNEKLRLKLCETALCELLDYFSMAVIVYCVKLRGAVTAGNPGPQVLIIITNLTYLFISSKEIRGI